MKYYGRGRFRRWTPWALFLDVWGLYDGGGVGAKIRFLMGVGYNNGNGFPQIPQIYAEN